MTKLYNLMDALADGPMTNAGLQELFCAHCGEVSRDMRELVNQKFVFRIIEKAPIRGGRQATYFLTAKGHDKIIHDRKMSALAKKLRDANETQVRSEAQRDPMRLGGWSYDQRRAL